MGQERRLENGARAWQGTNDEHKEIAFCQGMRSNNIAFTDIDTVVWTGNYGPRTPRMLLELTKYKFVGTESEMNHMFAMIDDRLQVTKSEWSSLYLAQKIDVPAAVIAYLPDVADNEDSLVQCRLMGKASWKRDIPAKEIYERLYKVSRGR